MNKRIVIMGGLAVIFGGVAIAGMDQWMGKNAPLEEVQNVADEAPAPKSGTLVVAAQELPYGTVIDDTMLREIPWPDDAMPDGAFVSADTFLANGKRVALRTISANEPVLNSKVTGPDGKATLSNLIEDGMRAMSIPVDATTGVSGFVVPGDRVDVILVREVNVDEDTGAIPAQSGLDKSYSRDGENYFVATMLLENVKVVTIDQLADDRQSEPLVVRNVTLEVKPSQATILAAAINAGELTLNLRALGDVKPGLPAIDYTPTASYTPTAQPNTSATITVRHKDTVSTISVRDEGVSR